MSSTELTQSPDTYRSRLRSKAAKWRESPERLAWIVMLVSFAIFCFLVITLPLAVSYTLRYATTTQDAQLSAITRTTGKVLLYLNPRSEPIWVRDAQSTVSEGMRIVSMDGAAQGTLSFVSETTQQVLGSLQIYSDTDVDIERLRRPFFTSSSEPYYVRLKMSSGQVRILSNSSEVRPLRVDVRTPQGLVRMENGSYHVSVNGDRTELQIRSGKAELTLNNGTESTIEQNQTVQVGNDQHVTTLALADQNWVLNGSFTPPVDDTWTAGPAENVVFPGEVTYVEGDGRQVAYFSELNADGHSDIGIMQTINRDVQALDSLVLQMDVKILFQSLPGAGQQASEYPVRAEINFTDVYGKEIKWGYGFYYRDLETGTPFPPPTSNDSGRVIRVRQGEWYTFESEDLIQLWKSRGTPPARINTIRIYASGHNYQSMVSEVYLLAH